VARFQDKAWSRVRYGFSAAVRLSVALSLFFTRSLLFMLQSNAKESS